MQDFIAHYGLWLLIALAVVTILVFLLKGKGQKNDTAMAPPKVNPAIIEPAPAEAAVPPPPPAPEAAPAAAVVPAAPVSAEPDNLLQIKGIGPKVNGILIGLGITRFEQVAAWTDADIAKIDAHLGNFAGRAVRDQWIDQAGYLARADIAGFEAKYGKL